jgi:hypothetical protein
MDRKERGNKPMAYGVVDNGINPFGDIVNIDGSAKFTFSSCPPGTFPRH